MITSIIGQNRGNLWAIGVNAIRNDPKYIIVCCSCGKYNEIEVRAFLNDSYICECNKEVTKQLNKRYGTWNVLERLENRKNIAYYRCACDCGNIKDIAVTNLIQRNGGTCKECRSGSENKNSKVSKRKQTEEVNFQPLLMQFKAKAAERFLIASGYGAEVATVLAPKPQEAALAPSSDAEAPLSAAAQSLKGIFGD
jgi:hypothetical protein